MIIPKIRFYARLDDCTGNGKIPKYKITAQAGYYPPMEELAGRDGKISMYLQVSKDSGSTAGNPRHEVAGKKQPQLYRAERLFYKRAFERVCLWLPVGGKDVQHQAKGKPVL